MELLENEDVEYMAISYKWVMDWITKLILYPCKRNNYCLLLYGSSNAGKTSLCNLIENTIGSTYFSKITQHDISNRFNDYSLNKLVVHMDEGKLTKDTIENIKPLVTNKSIRVEEKNTARFEHTNYCNLIITTNDENPMPLYSTPDDRRFGLIEITADSAEYRYDYTTFLNSQEAAIALYHCCVKYEKTWDKPGDYDRLCDDSTKRIMRLRRKTHGNFDPIIEDLYDILEEPNLPEGVKNFIQKDRYVARVLFDYYDFLYKSENATTDSNQRRNLTKTLKNLGWEKGDTCNVTYHIGLEKRKKMSHWYIKKGDI